MTRAVPEAIGKLPMGPVRPIADSAYPPPEFPLLSERAKPIELLNENGMGPVRYVYKGGARRQSICHNGLLIDVVLRLIANEDSIFGRSWIYVIQFSFVCDGGNLAGWQRAHSLLLFGRCHSFCSESGSHQ